jgi:hypothetical protein
MRDRGTWKMISMLDGDDVDCRHQCHVLSAVMEHGLLRPRDPPHPRVQLSSRDRTLLGTCLRDLATDPRFHLPLLWT